MKLRRKKSFEAEVATSSLNDIMFFLLLFFLIISTIANPNVIKVLLPKALIKPTIRWYHQVTGHPGRKRLYQHIHQ
jgi:biopolymer transport protein ExbD